MVCQKNKIRGFTLTEALLASVLIAIAAGSILIPFSAGASARAEADNKELSLYLANNLLEQILACDYENLITTYDGYFETEGQIKKADGSLMPQDQYRYFSRSVRCSEVFLSGQDSLSDSTFIKIEVVVYCRDREMVKLCSIKGR